MGDRANHRKQVVVIGGGISGLSAAYYVQKTLAEKSIEADITIVEKTGAFGGKIRTLHREGFVIEQGPDSFLARKLPIIELTRDLGLEGELTGTNPKANKTYIVHKGKLHRMPKGLSLGVPTELEPFLETDLMTLPGKARALMDFVLPKREETSDESLGGFFERRFGDELLRNLAEPILAGIYAGDTYKLSLQATFPQFQQLEREHGSLMKATMAAKLNPPAISPLSEVIPAEYRSSVFLTYGKGLVTLLNGLMGALEGVRNVQASVTGLSRQDGCYKLALDGGEPLEADVVIAALPSYRLAPLFGGAAQTDWLGSMANVSVANVVLAFDKDRLDHPLDGSGFVIPRTEGRFITACTWTSSKWLHTAPEGKALIRCYVGRSGEQDWMELTDEEIVARVRRDIFELMGVRAEPLFVEVTRLLCSMPQYEVGHLERISGLRNKLASDFPGAFVTGAAFEGVGIPDCIRQAKDAAYAATAYLERTGDGK